MIISSMLMMKLMIISSMLMTKLMINSSILTIKLMIVSSMLITFSTLMIDRLKISLSCHILPPPQRTAQSGFWTDVDRSTLQIYQFHQIDIFKSYCFSPMFSIRSERSQKAEHHQIYISKYHTFFLFV